MPMADPEVVAAAEKHFGVDNTEGEAVGFLISQGFTERRGFIEHARKKWDDLSDQEKIALIYLADEWDYAWDFGHATSGESDGTS